MTARPQDILHPENLHLFNEGRQFRLHRMLGAHLMEGGGVHFAVWAPNAKSVSVIGGFNGWDKARHKLSPVGTSGIWAGTVREAHENDTYKYHIVSHHNGYAVDKADPMAFCTETPPHTGSVIRDLGYEWNDAVWMRARGAKQAPNKPMSVYEVHLGSWRRKAEDCNRPLSYEELADELVNYVREMGFTHIELMPVMEHPFGGSWGYQITGYYAPTRRFGDPQQLMLLIDKCHQAGIGVILDWVPSHFPDDQHGLSYFDGTHLYEHHDPQKGFHPDWKSYIFNYGRNEVRSFLISNAIFWMEKYHIDALRIDAVSSMLYLDYSRKYGEWTPNEHGGRINLEALHFLRELNAAVYSAYPDTHLIAEESTDYPRVSRPVEMDGVGFGMKWDMGWMHDSLKFLSRDPVHRPHHQNDITFRSVYAFTENFMLPLSHDEVVYGKKSLMSKMPGDGWQQAAHLRSLFAYMYASPGKKLIFMGGEYGQWTEWNHNISLDWHLLGYDTHQGIHRLVTDLNFTYRAEESLFNDFDPAGFEWVDGSDTAKSVIAFLRKTPDGKEFMLCVFNFSGSAWQDYRIGVPHAGLWSERINSDNLRYGGSGGLNGDVRAQEVPHHGRPYSLCLRLPAASGIWLRWKP